MAFTESEKLDIAEVLDVDYIEVNDQIFNLGTAYITAAVETKVRAQLTRWATAGYSYVNIHPKEANKGAEIRANAPKDAIRRNIANLLYMSDWLNRNTTGGAQRITRG